jgi:putative serine protease PepD
MGHSCPILLFNNGISQDHLLTANNQADVRFVEANGGKVVVMSENEPDLGNEAPNENTDFAAPRPTSADETGAGPQVNPWGQPAPAAPAVPGASSVDPSTGADEPSAAQPPATEPAADPTTTNPTAPQPPAGQPSGASGVAPAPGAMPQPPPVATSYNPSLAWARPQQPHQPAPYPQAPQTQAMPGQPGGPTYGQPYGSTWSGSVPPPGPGGPGSAPSGAEQPGGAWRKAAVAAVAAAAIALGAGGVGGFVGYALHGSGSALQSTSSGSKNAAPVVDRSSLASIAAAIQPDVVVIQTSQGEGSGVVLSSDGYIVTNNHVVEGATNSSVKVTFNSGKSVQASIVGTDPKTDLAVVKVSGVSDLTFASWGNSDDAQVGDTVLAIGSPLGLQGSVTAGIISALHRTITVGGDQQSQFQAPTPQTTIGDAIQTDAPINPGNSGGALVDTNGKIIGINSAIATSGSTGNIGVGFAIPANRAKSVAQALITGGKVSHPYLGISVGDAQNGGAQVQSVQAGSPAEKAGLKVGDVVTKVGDRSVGNSEALVGAIQASSVGTKLNLTVQRNGSAQLVTVTVGESP